MWPWVKEEERAGDGLEGSHHVLEQWAAWWEDSLADCWRREMAGESGKGPGAGARVDVGVRRGFLLALLSVTGAQGRSKASNDTV